MSPHVRFVVFLSLGLSAVFAWHFATVLGIVGNAPQTRGEFFIRLGIIVVLFLICSAVIGVLMSKRDETAALPDEREHEIELKADRVGVAVIYIGLLMVMWFAFTPMSPMAVANAILAVVFASELIKLAYGVFILKRGF